MAVIEKGRATRISKYLSLVLRHKPSAAGVTLDAQGWVGVEELLAGAADHGFPFTRGELEEVVRTNDKQRFAFSSDAQRIRASQGHSVSVDLGLQAQSPPAFLYHGTVERFVASIMAAGLEKRTRQHVHLSVDIPTANRVGSRRGHPVILKIAAADMHLAGFRFFCSANGVWLTDEVRHSTSRESRREAIPSVVAAELLARK
jgi:putative RNA 2'-phosphotransferase